METVQIVWLALLVLFLAAEAVTVSLVSVWFAGGALVALLVSLFWPGALAVQVALFFVVSVVMLLALRPLAQKTATQKKVPTNADSNIGKMCQVVTEVQPGRFGRVKLEGVEWTAKSDHVLPVGTWCVVNAIEGVKLVVSPLPPSANGQQPQV